MQIVFDFVDAAVDVVAKAVDGFSKTFDVFVDLEERIEADDGGCADVADDFEDEFFGHNITSR